MKRHSDFKLGNKSGFKGIVVRRYGYHGLGMISSFELGAWAGYGKYDD